MTKQDKELLRKIRYHLHKLHMKWSMDPNSDGHCKSNEGYIGLFLHYHNWFETEDYLNSEPEVSCEIYSYLFGPMRLHEFNSLEEAWEEVKEWKYETR